jgi:hypothetical protein
MCHKTWLFEVQLNLELETEQNLSSIQFQPRKAIEADWKMMA